MKKGEKRRKLRKNKRMPTTERKPLIPAKELFKRYALFIVSLFISALGVAITKKAGLGVSPISSTANVMSLKFTQLSLGNWLLIWNCVLIAGQIIILRKKFQWIQLIQIPLSFLFGWFTDFGMWIFSFLDPQSYPFKLACVLIGTAVLGFGIALSVIANVVMNSGEAFVKAISDTIHKEFGTVKVVFDISCVILAVVLSMCFFNFKIEGTREGTIIAAVCTGFVVKFFDRLVRKPLEKLLVK